MFWNNRKMQSGEAQVYVGSMANLFPDVQKFRNQFRLPMPEVMLLPFSDVHYRRFRKHGIDPKKNEFLMEGGSEGADKDIFRGEHLWKARNRELMDWITSKRLTPRTLTVFEGAGGGSGTSGLKNNIEQKIQQVLGVRLTISYVVMDKLDRMKTWNLYNIGAFDEFYKENHSNVKRVFVQNIENREKMNELLAMAATVVSQGILQSSSGTFEPGDIFRWLPHKNSLAGFYQVRVGEEPMNSPGTLASNILHSNPLCELNTSPAEFVNSSSRILLFVALNTNKLDPEDFGNALSDKLFKLGKDLLGGRWKIDKSEMVVVPTHIDSDFVFCTALFPEGENWKLSGVHEVLAEAGTWVRAVEPEKPRDRIAEMVSELQRIELKTNSVAKHFVNIL